MRILVPRFIDVSAIKAQELNAKELFRRFSRADASWLLFHHDDTDPGVLANCRVELCRLAFPLPGVYVGHSSYKGLRERLSRELFKYELFFRYQARTDAIFYPDNKGQDLAALAFRAFCRRRVPIVATIEGLSGDSRLEKDLSRVSGHPVVLDRPSRKRRKMVQHMADHVIAISPLLKRYVELFLEKPCTVLPLGVNTEIFHDKGRKESKRPRILGAGSLNERKRPQVFVDLARRFPDVDFVWFGNGHLRARLEDLIKEHGLRNLSFPGSVPPRRLAKEMRASSLFVLPSFSEGWGKVTQEAQACGAPVIVFGHYGTPLVEDGDNGLVVWDDGELAQAVDRLLSDDDLRREMGSKAARKAQALSWDKVAPMWEERLLAIFSELEA